MTARPLLDGVYCGQDKEAGLVMLILRSLHACWQVRLGACADVFRVWGLGFGIRIRGVIRFGQHTITKIITWVRQGVGRGLLGHMFFV